MFESRHAPLELPESVAVAVAAAYGEPHRAYHTAAHIAEVLGWFDRVADDVGWQRPAEVYVAIVFHDAIYAPGAKDNEAKSAEWARSAGLSVDANRVTELILLTARHGSIDTADAEAALFLDCDMAILGSPPEAFAAYDRAIAIEYDALPPEAFRAGRRAFLTGLLAKPRIFLSDYFHTRLDAQARENLRRAITSSSL